MTEGQCAVFHFDVKAMSMRDPDAPLIFDSLADAESYSRDKITVNPGWDAGFTIAMETLLGPLPTYTFMDTSMASPLPSGACWSG
jgi:hypothetical protein